MKVGDVVQIKKSLNQGLGPGLVITINKELVSVSWLFLEGKIGKIHMKTLEIIK